MKRSVSFEEKQNATKKQKRKKKKKEKGLTCVGANKRVFC